MSPITTTLDEPQVQPPDTGDQRLAHLVLKDSWPTALCGANVSDLFGTNAPAMDRCVDCMRIARDRQLGRPGWQI